MSSYIAAKYNDLEGLLGGTNICSKTRKTKLIQRDLNLALVNLHVSLLGLPER